MSKSKQNILRYIESKTVKAIADYQMIKDGDKIALGISGGKDSLSLLYVLAHYQKFYGYKFHLIPVHVSMGWDVDLKPLEKFCDSLGLPLVIQPGEIGRIVFEVRQEKNPCSLCANLRRGALNGAALSLGCNKVALAHHLDDAIETFFLNLFYTSQIRTFSPRTYLDRSELTVIRPFIYVPEKDVINMAKKIDLPILQNPCPADRKTKREEAKELVKTLTQMHPKLRESFITALKNFESTNLWPKVLR